MRETLESIIQNLDLIKTIFDSVWDMVGTYIIPASCFFLLINKERLSEKTEIKKQENELIKADNDRIRALTEQIELIKNLLANVPNNDEKS
ncbi:MAG: hypothetical protein MJ211_07665 [Bacteroidales bacterium]|nr:hypothetical protein [Bacteroidales bacterium]